MRQLVLVVAAVVVAVLVVAVAALTFRVDDLADERDQLRSRMALVERRERGYVCAAPVHALMVARDDPEMLADMVLAAANEALRSATQAVEAKLRGQLPDLGALGLPGM